MRIVVAPDSFKGTLGAAEAGEAIAVGLRRARPDWEVEVVPIADGGEGTVSALVQATGGTVVRSDTTDPLGRPITAMLGLLGGGGGRAIVETASSSGIGLLSETERDPLVTSSRGTGALIRAAIDAGAEELWVGLGGSATVDGGSGMARALGVRFLDASGAPLPEGGGSLARLEHVDVSKRDPRLDRVRIRAACDVWSPLVGRDGAAPVFGPQKGASEADVAQLAEGLGRLADVIQRDLGVDVATLPGGGAAGGLGAGLVAFLGATLESGVELVLEAVGLRERIQGCDLVITGEGRLDAQTAHGKAPLGVARLAKAAGVPVIAIAGSLGRDINGLADLGFDAWLSAIPRLMSSEELAEQAASSLTASAEQVTRLLSLLEAPDRLRR